MWDYLLSPQSISALSSWQEMLKRCRWGLPDSQAWDTSVPVSSELNQSWHTRCANSVVMPVSLSVISLSETLTQWHSSLLRKARLPELLELKGISGSSCPKSWTGSQLLDALIKQPGERKKERKKPYWDDRSVCYALF